MALDACLRCLLEHPCDVLFHAAAYYGGIGINQTEPAKLYYTNLVMGANLMEAARLANVAKVVNIGTACSYPGYLEGDLMEEDLWGGPCHASVVNYGLTKKMLAVQGQAYKKQYGLESIHLILTNLYGPGDSYNPDRSHVVAALVRKWVEAEMAGAASIEVWGTGKPIREFIYVEDCADAIVLAAEKYHDVTLPLNIGTGIGTSIRELVETINDVTGFKGKIDWNADKPDGALKKVLDVTRMTRHLDGWNPPTGLRARTGQDDFLVPGQQGPGGCEMVNRRLWFRGRPGAFRPMFPDRGQWSPTPGASPPGIDDVVDLSTHLPGTDDDDEQVESTGQRLLFINQYYWPDHASTAQHLTDLAESLAARGYECHVLCRQGRYKAGAPAGELV